MTDLTWTTIRDEAVTKFGGETLGAQLETQLIDIFVKHPTLTLTTIDTIAQRKADGRITSGWAILKRTLDQAIAALENPTVDTGPDLNKRIRLAEAWITTTGIHYDRPDELEAELFDRGLLRPWAGDTNLRQRMTDSWQRQRHIGEQIEAEAIERGLKHQADRARIKAKATATAADTNDD